MPNHPLNPQALEAALETWKENLDKPRSERLGLAISAYLQALPVEADRVEAVAEWLAQNLPSSNSRQTSKADREAARGLLQTLDSTQPRGEAVELYVCEKRCTIIAAQYADPEQLESIAATRCFICGENVQPVTYYPAGQPQPEESPETAPIDCPACGAPAGYPCNAGSEGRALPFIHNTRAAKAAHVRSTSSGGSPQPEGIARLMEFLRSGDKLGHLHSVWEARLTAAQTAARERRNSGRRFPPEFIVKALDDDAELLRELFDLLKALNPEGETRG